jgi:TonB family protein
MRAPLLSIALALSLAACAVTPKCDSQCHAAEEAKGIPWPLERTQPSFPQKAASERLEGCTVVSFEILPTGKADEFQIFDSQPPGLFDMATLEALKDWRFAIPTRPGRYFQLVVYRLEPPGRAPEKSCSVPPSFEALNAVKAP